jgi:alkylation response protein AidB-like acyl-CoA dehydrogenase
VNEGFIHNFSLVAYIFLSIGAGHLIEKYGSEAQKRKYMDRMYAGEWGGTMALTEPEAGSDVGSLKTRAVRRPDGTYRIYGSKIFITGGDSDLYANIVHPVLARIEGDPAGTKGISIFLVPKFLVNDDGSLGRRNDYSISGIEHKMGLRGSATCAINFGDNGDCYAEILGQERQGMKIMFQLMNEARISVGLQGLGTASAAYLHALQYAGERLQGADIRNFFNPDAPRTPIIAHPDVRRMLLWMKSQVEGMRALVYFCSLCYDKKDETGEEKWPALLDLLTPVCKAYCTDIGFRVTETAIQVYGGYGYCQDYPVEQFLRDLKIGSIYEGTNGIQALDLVGRKLSQNQGKGMITLIAEMKSALDRYKSAGAMKECAEELGRAIDLLAGTAAFFGRCAKEGKFLVPVSNAYPFLMMMGTVCLGWLHFWQGGIAAEKLGELCREQKVAEGDPAAMAALLESNREAAFYRGKVLGAKYFIMNILPEAGSYAAGIQSMDMSVVEMPVAGF